MHPPTVLLVSLTHALNLQCMFESSLLSHCASLLSSNKPASARHLPYCPQLLLLEPPSRDYTPRQLVRIQRELALQAYQKSTAALRLGCGRLPPFCPAQCLYHVSMAISNVIMDTFSYARIASDAPCQGRHAARHASVSKQGGTGKD